MVVNRDFSCGQFLKSVRLRNGLGQAELAERAGMDQPAISRIERDIVSPSLETLNRLTEAMGEALMLSTIRLSDSVPGGSNQSVRETLDDFHELTPEERLELTAKLSEIATELAAGAGR